MAREDIVEYRNSILMEMERQSALEFAKNEGREEGRDEVRKPTISPIAMEPFHSNLRYNIKTILL